MQMVNYGDTHMQARKAMLILHGKQAMNEDVRTAVHDLRDNIQAVLAEQET